MNKKLLLKLCGLNFGLAFLNIAAFSQAIGGISLTGDSTVRRVLGYTIIVISVLLFLYGNYTILKSPQVKYDYTIQDLDTPGELVDALEKLSDRTALRPMIQASTGHIQTLKRKKESLKAMIYRKFNEEQDSLGLSDVVAGAEKLLYSNTKQIINGIAVFDQKEFERILPDQQPQKYQVYREQIDYIRNKVEENEAILLEFDRLLMEVSKLSDGTQEDAGELAVLRDVIANMKQL